MSDQRQWVKDAADRVAAAQVRAPRLRWLGPVNCEAVFAMIGWVHSNTELDHTEIRGLGPEGRDVAHWGDVIGWQDGHWCVLVRNEECS